MAMQIALTIACIVSSILLFIAAHELRKRR
jgi:hypothetical protein